MGKYLPPTFLSHFDTLSARKINYTDSTSFRMEMFHTADTITQVAHSIEKKYP